MKERGTLTDDTLVATVMRNLGLHRAMAEHGIRVVETKVGDRYVLEALTAERLRARRRAVGPRHHDASTRPPATACSPACTWWPRWPAPARSLAELASVMTVYPQVLVNVRGRRPPRAADDDEGIAAAVAAVEAELGDSGRVLLRPSGTEPMVRVMVEAAEQEAAERHAAQRSPTSCASASPSDRAERARAHDARSVAGRRSGIRSRCAQSLRSSTLDTVWSALLRSTSDARDRVGRMFCSRFGSLIECQISRARWRASSSVRLA